jgi:hypothetical protein
MGTYTAKTRSIGHRPRSKRLRELGGTVVRQIEGGEGGTADLSGYELLSNKVTAVTAESTDEQYPTAKLLFDLYTAIGLTLQALQNDKANTAYVDTQLGSLTSSIASIAGALQGKANASHSHAIADVTDLQTALGGKAAASHSHVISDLTNAAALFTQFALNSGVVNLTIGGQQRSITLPTAATPSGDPMHYVYEKLGCTYDTTTGLWTYRDLDDLTTEELNNAYVFTAINRNQADKSALYRNTNIRFTFAADSNRQDNQYYQIDRLCQHNVYIEHVYIQNTETYWGTSSITHALVGCSKLKAIHGIIWNRGGYYIEPTGTNKNAFNGCPQLTTLKIYKYNNTPLLYLQKDAALSLESIVFLIVNAADSASARKIILHADCYSRLAADTTQYTYQSNIYTGILALATARNIELTDVFPS